MEIPWPNYIARNNPDGVNNVLQYFGLPKADNYEHLFEAIDLVRSEFGEKATIELLKQHPDYDIIVETYKSQQPSKELMKNAVGDAAETTPQPIIITQPQQNIPVADFNSLLQNVVLAVMAFWIINKIISK